MTRAEPGAGRTAARLRALGFEPLVAPLIATRPLPGPPPDLSGVGALAFTSRAGVTAFVERAGAAVPDRSAFDPPAFALPVFAVGDATAQAARAAGFRDVRSAAGAGRDLLALIERDGPPGVVLHPGAREPAFDLVPALVAAGRPARALALYETAPAAALPPPAAAALAQGRIDAVLIHSPAAARALAGLVPGDPAAARSTPRIVLAALSAECAAPLARLAWAGVTVAPAPDEPSLLATLLGAGLDPR